jgi:hypothetical protein
LVSADAPTNVCRASNNMGSPSKYNPSLALTSLALGSVCAQDDTLKELVAMKI